MCPYGVVAAAVGGRWGRWPPSLAPLFVGDGSSKVTCCPPLRQPAPPAVIATPCVRKSGASDCQKIGAMDFRCQMGSLQHAPPTCRRCNQQGCTCAAVWGADTAPVALGIGMLPLRHRRCRLQCHLQQISIECIRRGVLIGIYCELTTKRL